MNEQTIIRAWKDPAYRDSLTPEQREALPENPSGLPLTELGEAELAGAMGGGAIGLYPNPDGPDYVPRGSISIIFTKTSTSPYALGGIDKSLVLQGSAQVRGF